MPTVVAPGVFQFEYTLEATKRECESFEMATPSVKNLAVRYNLTLRDIKGTGRDGRIMKEDVLAYMKSQVCSSDQAARLNYEGVSEKTTPKITVAPG